MSTNDPIDALREALKFSPGNIPLRQHIAETLLNRGEPEAAEQEYVQALALDPKNAQLKFGLARAFYQQSKTSQALVIVEFLLKQGEQTAPVLTLHARLLMRSGKVDKAIQQFRKALQEDPSLQESDLAERLGIGAEAFDILEGKVWADWADIIGDNSNTDLERPDIGFEEVGGMEALKEAIRLKTIYPLTHAEMYRAYGKAIGGSLLMYGAPGCGKTHLARATAGEIEAGFISVGLNDILDMWTGNSEKNLHDVFDQARRNSPCVLFFDEVDALATRRSDLRHSPIRPIVNQFLAELDGIQYSNEGVLILAATNAPWHLDNAFCRPGRFDHILFVPPPDLAARVSILKLHCQGKPTRAIDFNLLGKKTEHFSGADLKAVVERAIEKKLQDAIKTGIPKPLTTRDLTTAAASMRASTREWLSMAQTYAIDGNQDGMYDEILHYLQR
jgi:transitional endoplasmic reticulum ATPase